MIGTSLGPYRILSELGIGGMGTVYLAEDPQGTRRALKVLHSHLLASPGYFKRFLREAELGKRLDHQNVVRTIDVDAIAVGGKQHHFLVMEYVEGQTLRGLLREMGRVPEEMCRHIGREVAGALAAMHAIGIIHRDLKPENVLITDDHVVKVMDFGVAHLVDEAVRFSQSGGFVGSVLYAAPEQFEGLEPDPRADWYSLGLVLYELATGTHPSRAVDFASVMHRRLEESPRPAAELNPQLSPFFEEVLDALLARDPGRRLDFLPADEESDWWSARAATIRRETRHPPRRIRIPRETALYGRDAELERLDALFGKTVAGHGQVLLIDGEAGIGKTRLLDEFAARLGDEAHFLFGSYPPGGAATATGAFSTAYRRQFGDTGAGDYLRSTPSLVPAFEAILRGDTAPQPLAQECLQTAFVHATRALAEELPTVVVIEDLHFAPDAGRALFAALALGVPGHRILLIGTTRPGLPDEWVANLARFDHADKLDLSRLGPKDLSRLLADAFRSERLADELGYRIAVKSDGNPFFAFEIIRGLREGQYITQTDDGSWITTSVIDDIEIPDTVRDLIQARIADLDEDDAVLLDVAACCGFEFDPQVVAPALGRPLLPVLQSLGRVEKRHRLVCCSGRRYQFDHHQVQEVLYGSLSELLREQYHAKIAAALEPAAGEATGERALEIAQHSFLGGCPERGLRYLPAALAHLA